MILQLFWEAQIKTDLIRDSLKRWLLKWMYHLNTSCGKFKGSSKILQKLKCGCMHCKITEGRSKQFSPRDLGVNLVCYIKFWLENWVTKYRQASFWGLLPAWGFRPCCSPVLCDVLLIMKGSMRRKECLQPFAALLYALLNKSWQRELFSPTWSSSVHPSISDFCSCWTPVKRFLICVAL